MKTSSSDSGNTSKITGINAFNFSITSLFSPRIIRFATLPFFEKLTISKPLKVSRSKSCVKAICILNREVLSSLTGFELTRGLLCAMRRPKESSLDEVLANAKRVAVLERLSDAVNIGAIFRSAAALGIDAVLLFNNCAEPLNRRTVRVSMGSVFLVPWAFFDKENFKEPQSAADYLRQKGFKTAALALKDNSINITDSALKTADRLALFLGAEGDGLSSQTIDACDYTVKIPMHHNVDSLNVANAATIAFWELGGK